MTRRFTLTICGIAAVCLFLAAGCGPQQDQYQEYQPEGEVAAPDEHHHAHGHGTHDGHLIELGDEDYHAELVFDEESRQIIVYVLDSAAKEAVALDVEEIALNLVIDEQPVSLKLAAAPQEGDAEGRSSRFQIAGDQVPQEIHDEEDLEGRLSLTIDGVAFSGDIEHDHDHDHGHEDHDDEHHDEDRGHEDQHNEGEEHATDDA